LARYAVGIEFGHEFGGASDAGTIEGQTNRVRKFG
jgi:hypothetical protein